MTTLSLALAVAWPVTILILIFDMVEWQFSTEDLRTRQLRSMKTVVVLFALTLFALWTTLLPVLEEIG